MRLPYAMLAVGDGPAVRCYPGSVLGRLAGARLVVPDPEVPEAAALVSARRDGLYLLALRRPLRHRGEDAWNVRLAPDLELALAPRVRLTCRAVWLPDRILALRLDDRPARPLSFGTHALRPDEDDWLVAAPDGELWATSGEFHLRTDDGVVPLEPGATLPFRGHELSVLEVERDPTRSTRPEEPPERVEIDVHPDRVEVRLPAGGAALELTRRQEDVLRTLADLGGRAGWEALARGVWGGRDWHSRRERCRANLYNSLLPGLDRALRAAGIRDDCLVRAGGQVAFHRDVAWRLLTTF